MSSRTLLALFVACLAFPLLGAPTGAVDLDEDGCVKEHLPAVGDVCRLSDGLYLGHYDDGTPFTTHGPDPIPDGGDVELQGVEERQPRCATDNYQHILYGRPANVEDSYGRSVDGIRSVVRHMNWILNEDALESGGVTADYKVLCDEGGFIRVDSFVVPSSSSDFNAVVSAARNAGFNDNRVDYTIFYEGTSSGVCGVGHISYDERAGANNANNNGGDYGVTYHNCWTGRTPMHENGHNQGAVQRSAPDSDGAGHCIEGRDIMCYPTSAVLVLCGDRIHYDCDHDTYFNADPNPGGWLATNWNIGSRVNRFIAFGDTDPLPPNEAPVANITFTLDGADLSATASGSTDTDGDTLHYRWNLGDGNAAQGETIAHTYATFGRYALTLTVSDAKGGIDTLKVDVVVLPDVEARVETFHFDGRIGCAVAATPIQTADQCRDETTQQIFDVLIDAGVSSTHVELRWGAADTPAGLFSAAEMQYSWLNGAVGGDVSGPSPVVGDHPVEPGSTAHVSGSQTGVEVRPSGLSGFVKDQAFDLCVVVLYGDAVLPNDACA